MRRMRWVALVAALIAIFVVGGAGAALSDNPNAGCDQTPYEDGDDGANQSGPYDDTCDGSPSANGNGGGDAKGKPCAGCVGQADEKNPPGQNPNGGDANAGYECDTNSGIGKTNPAHSGCVDSPDEPDTPDVGSNDTPRRSVSNKKTTTLVLGTKFLAKTGPSSTVILSIIGTLMVALGAGLRFGIRQPA